MLKKGDIEKKAFLSISWR